MNKDSFFIEEGDENLRIDKFLVDQFQKYSRTEIQSFIKNGHVTVNGKKIKANYRCQAKDKIEIYIPVEEDVEIKPEDLAIDILHEDEGIIIVYKPRGMVVYPTVNHQSGTLVNALLHHTKTLSTTGGKERPGIVHRLDKDTSGLLVVAKTDDVYDNLTKQFANREVERIYGALVHGDIPHNKGVIDAPIGRDPKVRTQMAILDEGKEAITKFTVKERYGDYTYVECELITGRTHQIRLHLNYIGHSIVGEETYINHKTLSTEGQLLFAKSLAFCHPVTKEAFFFEVERPKLFKDVLKELGVD